ncbi:hypothetical protein CTEN210_15694 [Chaetoceros tenuissimus]|uniref:Glycosyltransferase 2-like domain-containing protein n=1 Tax=Chaetoceros tenuissimus TaxID=426638 RepID=A0AAD3D7L7_9STRA|nr:hypothetical protein CTEN210_15694 [Chaetoceros tenuissimus]
MDPPGTRLRISNTLSADEIMFQEETDGSAILGLIGAYIGNEENDHYSTSENAAPVETDTVEDDNNVSVAASSVLDMMYSVIIFSKDRPWQLSELLRSMELEKIHQYQLNISIKIILFASNTDFQKGYERVKEMNQNYDIDWLYEERNGGDNTFSNLLENAVQYSSSSATKEEEEKSLTMFLTDDCILLKPIYEIIRTARSVLYEHKDCENIITFVTRLHIGISYCQTKGVPSPIPRSHLQYAQSEGDIDSFYYPLKYGQQDFAYPFDLSGGIYRRDVLSSIFEDMRKFHSSDGVGFQKDNGYNHPNKLEINGNKALSRLNYLGKEAISFPSEPLLRILAINRVQDVFEAPIATSDQDSLDAVSLLPYIYENKHLDLKRYQRLSYNTSHIGDTFVSCKDENLSVKRNANSSFAVSVLIPVHVGPRKAAGLAMKSILEQTLEDGSDSILPLQVVIVDDRCEDGSISEMISTAKSTSKETRIRDFRSTDKQNTRKRSGRVCIDIVKSPSPGIAQALNFGLKHCEADLVARMDADDVMNRGHIRAQVEHLLENNNTAVIGSSCAIFAETNAKTFKSIVLPFDLSSKRYNLLRLSCQPTDPCFVAWCMIFSCVITHASVVFRKQMILQVGGYNEKEGASCSEDYDLWLRLLSKSEDITCIKSLPRIGIFHRKHPKASKVVRQNKESDHASFRYLQHIFDLPLDDVKEKSLFVLRNPKESDPLLLNDAAEFLGDIESQFLTKYKEQLTENEVKLIQLDTGNRIAELATLSIDSAKGKPGRAWEMWCNRCPEANIERLALLMKYGSSEML